ncbi:hypothetical protein O6H91_04G018100 [Diphasiastrum complanatum]|uniref:Uncharacterized protein n=1 Tax=Diphasiastrum complanatum TaxID=34168 RepID=A0ACC2DUI6_DIPCM|nr:hypothetical protein O6H91_04G018100 [Diphasiastrum complanatum]
MSPRLPVLGAIPERITVNFMLPHDVEMEAQQVDMVILPPTTGHMGVIPGHVPTIAELKPGVLSVHEGDQDVKTQYFVSSGFAFMRANSVTDVIAIKAVPLDECACPERLSRKATSALKFTRNVTALNNLKTNGSQSGKKGKPSGDEQKKKLSLPNEVANETSLKRSAAGDQTDICMEDFCLDVELFAGWGIILPHIEVEELLQVRKEIENADFPTSTADKSIWLHVLFKSSLHMFQEPQNDACNEFSNEDDFLERENFRERKTCFTSLV